MWRIFDAKLPHKVTSAIKQTCSLSTPMSLIIVFVQSAYLQSWLNWIVNIVCLYSHTAALTEKLMTLVHYFLIVDLLNTKGLNQRLYSP